MANTIVYMRRAITTENAAPTFEYIYNKYVHREGADKFLEWLKATDFFTSPASTRFHLCVPAGLVLHSVHVYLRLRDLYIQEKTEKDSGVSYQPTAEEEESIAIVGLLHDICKANCYVKETKNRKQYDPQLVAQMRMQSPREVKFDSKGEFFWETYESYGYEDHDPYGHGEKSVRLIWRNGLTLTDAEEYAIRYHMGPWNCPREEYNALSNAYQQYPLAALAHTADMLSSYIDEADDTVYRVQL